MEELQKALEKDRTIATAHRQKLLKSTSDVELTNGHHPTSKGDSSTFESRAVTFDLSPAQELTDDGRQEMVDVKSDRKVFDGNSFYHNIMYSSVERGINSSPSKTSHQTNNFNVESSPPKSKVSQQNIECIELSSTDDEEEIDDPEEDEDDYEIISDFEDDENLADAIRNVPGAASAAIRMKFAASDPLSII